MLLVFLTALLSLLPFPSEPSDSEKIDALAPVEIVAEGFREPTGIAIDPSGAVFVSDRQAGNLEPEQFSQYPLVQGRTLFVALAPFSALGKQFSDRRRTIAAKQNLKSGV